MTGETEAEILWEPSDPASSPLAAFIDRYADRLGLGDRSYRELYRASIDRPGPFFRSVAEFCTLKGSLGGVDLVGGLPDAAFFPEGMINYAEEAHARFTDPSEMVAVGEEGGVQRISASAFWGLVGRLQDGLRAVVEEGDRVAAYLPNVPEAVVGLNAAAGLGAIWSCCSPEFGSGAVIDRFAQIEPKVLLAAASYRYNGRTVDRSQELAAIVAGLPSLELVVMVGGEAPELGVSTVSFDSFGEEARPVFRRVPFNHPLWVLYSSGTTGIPKAIVHSHGGIVLEHKKVLELQGGITTGSRFFWYTSTGWMMWNFLVGGLLVGASIVLADGAAGWPDLSRLWRLIDEVGIEYFGVSAPFLQACQAAGVRPEEHMTAATLKMIGSTGAPLTASGFRWVYDHVPAKVQLVSTSGGTDVCTAFLGSSPLHPTYLGRISTASLGVEIKAYNEAGSSVTGEMGELVIEGPIPSMPVGFWGDPDRSRYHAAYFDRYPGVWRHGDWVTLYEDGTAVIYGRSDSTLNRGGVRMGTADFYAVVEAVPGVVDALVVDTSSVETAGELILFLVAETDDFEGLVASIRAALRASLSPRHVPDRIFRLSSLPKTLNGKKLEVPVRRLFLGAELAVVASTGSIQGAKELEEIAALAKRWRAGELNASAR